jgi:hypothetical protein
MHRILFQLWLYYVAGMVCFGWLLSAMNAYRWMGAAALPLACTLAFLFHGSWRGMQPEEKECLKNDLRFPPFLILLLLIALAGSLYTTAVLDSLSYRIPRMLMWLQEGSIHYIDNPDGRLNFMTPVWEFATTPLYQAAGFQLLWLGSGISWVLLYLAFIFLSRRLGADPKTSRWLAIIPSASVGFVLQAASTMNDVWAAAFIAISLAFILMFEEKQEFCDLVSCGLALALAAGAKPHFAVLALPWLIWCLLSRTKPLSSVRWRWALPVAALVLVCSPLPTFITNHLHYGSFKGPAGDSGFGLGHWWINLLLGSVMMGWQMLQPPINPWARSIETTTAPWFDYLGLHDLAPRFGFNGRELAIVDSASIGICVLIILSIGVIISINSRIGRHHWTRYAAISGIIGFLIAVSQVVPSTLGRSFLAFTVLLVPYSLNGLKVLKSIWLRRLGLLVTIAAAGSLILSPSHPLWPTTIVTNRSPKIAHKLKNYFAFHERAMAGKTLLAKVPESTNKIGVFANGDQSLINLWGDSHTKHQVSFFSGDTTLDTLHSTGPEYNILIGLEPTNGKGPYLALRQTLESDVRFSIISKEYYISKLDRGAEPWILFKRNSYPSTR